MMKAARDQYLTAHDWILIFLSFNTLYHTYIKHIYYCYYLLN